MEGRKVILKTVIDLIAGGILLFAFLFPRFSWIYRPFTRGYFESDNSIRYPFIWHSITLPVLVLIGGLIYCVMVLITEFVRHKRGLYKDDNPNFGGFRVYKWLRETYSYIYVYVYGVLACLVFVYIGKNSLGTLRPHFIEVCRPSPWTDSWSAQQNSLGYIIRYDCQGFRGWWAVMDARMSFPSAHATFAMYTCIFFILYLERKAKWHVAKSLRHLFQFCTLLATWYVGITRIVENWSHWSDVAAGYLIGGILGVVFFVYFLKPSKLDQPSVTNTQQQNQLQPSIRLPAQQPIWLPNQQPTPNQPIQYIIHYHQQPQPQPSGCPRCNCPG